MPLMGGQRWTVPSRLTLSLPISRPPRQLVLFLAFQRRSLGWGEGKVRVRGPETCQGGQGLGLILAMVELTGLLRSPLAPLFTDGPCYSLVVLLVGKSKDTPFCSFGWMRVRGSRGRTQDRQAQTLIPLSPLNPPVMAHVLGAVRVGPCGCVLKGSQRYHLPARPPSPLLLQGPQHLGKRLGLEGGEVFSVCASVNDRARKGEMEISVFCSSVQPSSI